MMKNRNKSSKSKQMLLMIMLTFHNLQIYNYELFLVSLLNRRLIFPLKLCSQLTYTVVLYQYCIVLYFRIFSNMDYKRHPFTLHLYDTIMQKVRVETPCRAKNNKNMVELKVEGSQLTCYTVLLHLHCTVNLLVTLSCYTCTVQSTYPVQAPLRSKSSCIFRS